MSVSYVVPVWREETWESVAKPWIVEQVKSFDAELIEVRGASSIFCAMEEGRQRAKHRHIMYVHDDVRLITPMDLTPNICAAFENFPKLGLIGPVGKVQKKRVPWWLNAGPYVGHYCRRGNSNELVYQYADETGASKFRSVDENNSTDFEEPCWNKFAVAGLVDGFYLIEHADRMNVPWDIKTYGEEWHGYDMDRCWQAHKLKLDVMVPDWLFLHDNAGHAGYKGTNPAKIHGKDQANRQINSEGDKLWLADLDRVNVRVRRKWNVR